MQHRLTERLAKAALGIALGLGLGFGTGLGLASCFTPTYHDCAFRCGPEAPACPEDYTCQPDGYCHRRDTMETCPFVPLPDLASPADLSGPADLAGTD